MFRSIFPFSKPPIDERPELTSEAYSRWLRAQRPPMDLFLRASDLEQEALADLGDEHSRDLIEALGIALSNPQALAAGSAIEPGSEEEEASQARGIAERFAADLIQGLPDALRERRAAEGPRNSGTMSGIAQRRAEAAQKEQEKIDSGRTLFGMSPNGSHRSPEDDG